MRTWLRIGGPALALALGLGCGGDDGARPPDGAPIPDGTPGPDAGSPDARPFCYELTDEGCGYVPEQVTSTDIPLADQQALAERFNPGQVFTHPHIWSVSMDYLLVEAEDGLEQAEHDGLLNFSYDVDETTRQVVTPQPDLLGADWSSLPTTGAGGRRLVYFADVPGDNTGRNRDEETWSAAWIAAQGGNDADPTTATYPPTQYAHLFWLSRAEGLLAIQYWFYYPYDKWTNVHEGDIEHANIVLRYHPGGAPHMVGAHFSHHGAQTGRAAANLIRVADRDGGDGDHVVVFTGGDSCLTFFDETWCGQASGASFPYPGTYTFNSPEIAAGGATLAGRPIHANDFAVVLLPRAEDIDFAAQPNLSWYNVTFMAGQPTVAINAAAVIGTDNHRAPVRPGPDHAESDVGIEDPYDFATYADPEPFIVPAGWTMIQNPSGE
jgi:hypothetical protein